MSGLVIPCKLGPSSPQTPELLAPVGRGASFLHAPRPHIPARLFKEFRRRFVAKATRKPVASRGHMRFNKVLFTTAYSATGSYVGTPCPLTFSFDRFHVRDKLHIVGAGWQPWTDWGRVYPLAALLEEEQDSGYEYVVYNNARYTALVRRLGTVLPRLLEYLDQGVELLFPASLVTYPLTDAMRPCNEFEWQLYSQVAPHHTFVNATGFAGTYDAVRDFLAWVIEYGENLQRSGQAFRMQEAARIYHMHMFPRAHADIYFRVFNRYDEFRGIP